MWKILCLLIVAACIMIILLMMRNAKRQVDRNIAPMRSHVKPFSVSEYFDRIEQAALEILESRQPAGNSITLWFGLNGLRLNENGSCNWIKRKKPEPPQNSVFYQPQQSLLSQINTGMMQLNTELCNARIPYPQYLYCGTYNPYITCPMQGYYFLKYKFF